MLSKNWMVVFVFFNSPKHGDSVTLFFYIWLINLDWVCTSESYKQKWVNEFHKH